MAKETICLNMIVKNERHIIEKCLEAAKMLGIDYWIIVDTGSTDGTQNLIRDTMKNIPGNLYERPWVNFEHNRNEALALAAGTCDYILFVDADEVFSIPEAFTWPTLDKDAYRFVIRQPEIGVDYQRILLINTRLNWKWQGVVHESIVCPEARNIDTIEGVIALSYTIGDRSKDPKKYSKDAELLEKALAEEPDNPRYVFYLAQSYLNVPDYEKALKYYEKRASMQGEEEERFFSLYLVGQLQETLKYPAEAFLKSYANAFQFRPSRAEPLFRIATHFMRTENYLMGYLVSKFALSVPHSKDSMFVEKWIYDWGRMLAFAESSYKTGHWPESLEAVEKLLATPELPPEKREFLEKNRAIIQKSLDRSVSVTSSQISE